MALITEEHLERQAIAWFRELGYAHAFAPDLGPDSPSPERTDYRQVILGGRLRAALRRLNPGISIDSIDAAVQQLANPDVPGLLAANRQLHRWITQGVPSSVMEDNQEVGVRLKVIGFDDPAANNWLVVNQLAVQGHRHSRRPDLVIYLNGLPVAVVELKNPANEKADIWAAFRQLQTYKTDIPELFAANVLLVISDGLEARVGSLSAERERFLRWRTIDHQDHPDPLGRHRDLETMVRGLFQPQRLLAFVRSFCLFEENGSISKKIAAYHQFHAVQAAAEQVVRASRTDGDKKGGVVWHTQGSGKSIEMAFLAGALLTDPRLGNPTLVMVTDRQDLDGQLFGVFAGAGDLLGETPRQVQNRRQLRHLLENRPSGGIIFTTMQKFAPYPGEQTFPVLSDRHNIVVICDEAHRTQYGLKARLDARTGIIRHGFAKALRDGLPAATFLAFTGTPLSRDDRDTRAVFGNYVSVYDIQQAVEDGATVPIYYESRLARLALDEALLPWTDQQVDELFADEDDIPTAERAKTRWAALEALVGAQPRLQQVAEDLVNHHERRCRTQPGKALVVAMSRDICVRLYNAIIALRPHWHDLDHRKGAVKVVMTAAAHDGDHLQPHRTNQQQRKDLEQRFKDPGDPLRMVLVRDMWLTGFDVPCLTTLYVDKLMRGANLAQAIARVNRVFKDKPGGLVVDYIGIAPQLKQALATYTAAQGRGAPTMDISEALGVLKEKLQVAKDLLHPVDWSGFLEPQQAMALLPLCLDHVLGLPDGKQRFCNTVLSLTRALALCGALEEALVYTDHIAFLQAVRAALMKDSGSSGNSRGTSAAQDKDFALRRLVSEALVAEGVTDIFHVAGLEKPDISILSDSFLEEVRRMPHKNLAVELLRRLLTEELTSRFKNNVVRQRKFSEMLQASLAKYTNRSIEAAQVIEELIAMAQQFRDETNRMDALGLTPAEVAFYDALANNSSAQDHMGDEVLKAMAEELAEKLRNNLTIDWKYKDNVRARLRRLIKTLLKRYKYPPDQRETAVDLVLTQAEVLAEDMTP
ncbi:MAG: type I restriction endonuclease subunit R [Synechococcus sp. SB0666_bin_14]|nr:type I restriction endonuclease subunit R [Synechococcus sp. SB0666_bin_14]MYG46134.1 type I restriction endonuclease subunit R [Synechococcus sp. SB0675_bin_6]MYK91259.1 type I restriction endonuclease subunit R [Synechococcus sp. SB0669_bin_8]